MPTPLSVIDAFEFAPPQTYGDLTMVPLLARADREAGYLTLDEAVQTGRFRVTEVSEAGNVPELRVVNDLDVPVLLLDGEELVGAKQNRIVNLTILVPAKTGLTIPVSCVEAGRWRPVSPEFHGSDRAQFAEGRARKAQQVSMSMSMGEAPRSDQSEVWSLIAHRVEMSGVESPTGAMADVFDAHAVDIDGYVRGLTAIERQAGAAFAIRNRFVGIELFDASATLSRVLPKIIRSYAFDAAVAPSPAAAAQASENLGPDQVIDWMRRLGDLKSDAHDAVGVGEDLRWNGNTRTAAALMWGDRMIHFVGFALDSANEGAGPSARMQSASWRRRQQRGH